ncbi:hypothetical protein ACFL13_02085 [Patescibacteria group bacterium]
MNLFKWLTPKNGGVRSTVSGENLENIRREWQNIAILVQGGQPSQLRNALIVADKTLDNALKDIVRGENMGERLKNARSKFDPVIYNKVWQAHKMRNSLVHEAGYEPPHHMLKNGIEDLKIGLSKLGVIV